MVVASHGEEHMVVVGNIHDRTDTKTGPGFPVFNDFSIAEQFRAPSPFPFVDVFLDQSSWSTKTSFPQRNKKDAIM
jgi:hypothetical protein